ncbi:hypothetical protein ABFS82_07G100600 [Erythranthe guttata]
MAVSNDYDLLNPPAELEKRKHKLKRLVQSPNSFFMKLDIIRCVFWFVYIRFWCIKNCIFAQNEYKLENIPRNLDDYVEFDTIRVDATTVFSHSQTVVVCGNCQTVLCQPTGGRARLTEGCSFRRKGD